MTTYLNLTYFCRRNPEVLLAPQFAYGSGPIFLKNIACKGSESDIEECSRSEWGVTDCQHAEDVGIDCCKFKYTHFHFSALLTFSGVLLFCD